MPTDHLPHQTPAAIAVNRFGLGFSPAPNGVPLANNGTISDAKQWLTAQINHYQALPIAWQKQANTLTSLENYQQNQQAMKQVDGDEKKDAKRLLRKEIRDDYQLAVIARAESALDTPTPFIERLVHFWANHFAISIEKPAITELAGAFELEAIRPYVLGNFVDLLLAVEKHPAMLMYLDQVKSIGPNSPATARLAQRADDSQQDKKRGLNENLAREIMELHTLGVRSGYTQADVTEFARALTGWNIVSLANTNAQNNRRNQAIETGVNGFTFRPILHEPGDRVVLGRSYNQSGKNQAEAILRDFASSTATATHIATKLARHFVSDTPPEVLVQRLAQVFLNEGGNLSQVYHVLIGAPESWQATATKFKTPWEWAISSLRGLGRQNMNNINIAQIMNQLGQPVWRPGSPAGYDDIAEAWAAPNALLRRVELAQRLANPLGDKIDARMLSEQLLMGVISTQTQTAITRSESAATGLALLLVSPEFLRR